MEPGTIVIISVLGTLIFLGLLRWFLAIDGLLGNQRATIAFLIKLCEQQGVTGESLDELKKKFKLK